MTAVVVSRNEKEKVLIEPSINSIRISISIKQADDIERILCHKFMRYSTSCVAQFISLWFWCYLFCIQLSNSYCKLRFSKTFIVITLPLSRIITDLVIIFRFMMMRAENFIILRRKPVEVSPLCFKGRYIFLLMHIRNIAIHTFLPL